MRPIFLTSCIPGILLAASIQASAQDGTRSRTPPPAVPVPAKTQAGMVPSSVQDPASLAKLDTRVPVAAARASNQQQATRGASEGPVEASFDGDLETIYHSSWSGGGFPITLEYVFRDADRIDYLVYHPRSGNDNGLFQQAEIWWAGSGNPQSFAKACDFDFKGSNTSAKVVFPVPLRHPAAIRIVVKGGVNNYASCAEMQFYRSEAASTAPPAGIFADPVCGRLAPGVTRETIDRLAPGFFKTLAQGIMDGTYPAAERVREYSAYPAPTAAAEALRISGFSHLENPTGIHFRANSIAVVLVGETAGRNLALKVHDRDTSRSATYPLEPGVNRLRVSDAGLGYIQYFTGGRSGLEPVKIHVCGGEVNGVYRLGETSAAQWRSMLAGARSNMIDLVGNRCQLLYPVAGLRKHSPHDARELVAFYDEVVDIQYRMMGLHKYGRLPKNHMLAEATDKDGSWHAGSFAHYGGGLDNTCSAADARNNPWGIAHELGHVNTMGGMRWVSTTEVMNNVYSVWTEYLMAPPDQRRLEKETCSDAWFNGDETGNGRGKGVDMAGGRFNAYLNNGILKGEHWLCQYGPDSMGSPPSEWRFGNGDHFVKLCPLWQLTLYYQVARPEKKDWYADISELARRSNAASLSDSQRYCAFMRNACDATREDLTDFFTTVGMLKPIDRMMKDYGNAQLTVTAADIAAIKAHVAAKKYPKPDSPVIHYLSANSVDAYQKKLPVSGTAGKGCAADFSAKEGFRHFVTVDHAEWKNVAVFETYRQKQLVRISLVGSGHVANDKTRVYFPEGSTSIYAVAWNGERTLVYGNPILK